MVPDIDSKSTTKERKFTQTVESGLICPPLARESKRSIFIPTGLLPKDSTQNER